MRVSVVCTCPLSTVHCPPPLLSTQEVLPLRASSSSASADPRAPIGARLQDDAGRESIPLVGRFHVRAQPGVQAMDGAAPCPRTRLATEMNPASPLRVTISDRRRQGGRVRMLPGGFPPPASRLPPPTFIRAPPPSRTPSEWVGIGTHRDPGCDPRGISIASSCVPSRPRSA